MTVITPVVLLAMVNVKGLVQENALHLVQTLVAVLHKILLLQKVMGRSLILLMLQKHAIMLQH